MAITGWPLKVDTRDDDVFLLVSERLSCDRGGHAASSQPLHDIDVDTYDYSIARNLRARLRQYCLHMWPDPLRGCITDLRRRGLVSPLVECPAQFQDG
jgi:hypothetical protein